MYLDANVIVRLVEGVAGVRSPIEQRIAAVSTSGADPVVTTSKLSRIECRCKPLAMTGGTALALYDTFFAAAELQLLDVDDAVIEKATELRAKLNVKTPDAIHLASAIVAGASVFLTGDQALARCKDVAVEVM